MKSYASPPEIVEIVMEAVCILFKKKYTWNDSKLLMGNIGKFKESLVNFEKDKI
jgi:dynein heavy chain